MEVVKQNAGNALFQKAQPTPNPAFQDTTLPPKLTLVREIKEEGKLSCCLQYLPQNEPARFADTQDGAQQSRKPVDGCPGF